MKNNKGFTLVEIIVSIALLGIISVGMIAGLTAQFQFLTDTQAFTENLAAVQQRMEQAIYQNKLDIKNHETPDGTPVDITLEFKTADGHAFAERTVTGYATDETISAGALTVTLDAVVGPEILNLPVATITNASLVFKNPSSAAESTAYTYAPSLFAKVTETVDTSTGDYLTSIYHWYVSRPGFNIPMISATPGETEMGTVYPRFPADYELIPGVSTSSLSSVASRYEGRHIVCTVTPSAPSYKLGDEVASNPLFISGLPVKNDLAMHLDASMIDREDTSNQVRSSGGNFYVKQWRDISGEGSSAAQSTSSRQPRLVEYDIGYIIYDGVWYDSYAKYASFDGGDWLNTSFTGTVDPGGTASTVFVVARDAGAANFTIYQNSTPGSYGNYVNFTSGYGTTTATIGNNSGTAVDVAEVIVYTARLSDGDAQAVKEYLEDKYLPETPDVAIRWLNNVSVTVVQNSTYTTPATVSAYMTSGRYQDVAVTWNPAAIDTTTLGTKTSTGTAVSDPSQTCRLSVSVVPPTALTGIASFTVYSNGTYGVLTAGALSPAGATASYQWQISYDGGDNWTDVDHATSSVYSSGVWGSLYRVKAEGNGLYTGIVYSTGQTLSVTTLTSIGAPTVTGGTTYAQLTAGDLTPAGATVTYQWQRSSSASGPWTSVDGAISRVYDYGTWGQWYRVIVTGSGGYSGSLESSAVRATQVALTGIGDISIYWSGNTPILTAGAVNPSGATVDWQWQYYSGRWRNVSSGGTYSTYSASTGTRYRVTATGTGMYTGTVTSAEITPTITSITNIGDITYVWNDDGTLTLTAGAVTPSGANVDYMWESRPASGGSWGEVGGNSNVFAEASPGRRYRVTATGKDGYKGSDTSNVLLTPSRTQVTGVSLSKTWNSNGTATLTPTLTPAGAAVSYVWTDASGQTVSTASVYTAAAGQTYTLTVTGIGGYYGSSSDSIAVTRIAVTGVGNITISSWSAAGVPTLAAGAVTPAGATVSYQWLDSAQAEISGATSSTYNATAGQTYYVRVTGTGEYSGSRISAAFTPNRIPVTNVSISVSWSGTTPTLSAASVTPSGANITYQWLDSSGGNIYGATSSTYVATAGQTYSLRVSGYGAYSGSATSAPVTPQISITGVGAITVSSWSTAGVPTLAAGAVNPSGATVSYQWLDSAQAEISGATSATYNAVAGQAYYVRVTGTGAYTGAVTSARFAVPDRIALKSIGAITISSWSRDGVPILVAGAVNPTGATVSYQWLDSAQAEIFGATSTTNNATAGLAYYVRVTGTGAYIGEKTSAPFTPTRYQLQSVSISKSSNTLSAVLNPTNATVDYSWQRQTRSWSLFGGWSSWSSWSEIGTNSTCSFTSDSWFTEYRYQVSVEGYGQYYGSATSSIYSS